MIMDIVLKQRLYEKLWKDNYYKGADVFREQIRRKEFADLITESKPAMNVVFEEMENAGEEYRFLPEIFFSSCINVGKGLATYAELDHITFDSFNTINEIITSSINFEKVVSSKKAMQAIAGSSTAMNAVVKSSTAMNAVAGSSTAMSAIAGSSMAMNIFFGSRYHVGKGIATYARLSHSTFDSLSSISAVAGSSTAMNAVAGSSAAMNAVAGSSIAMNAVAGSSTAMNAVAGSSTAMNAVAGSAIAFNMIVKSSMASQKVASRIQSYRSRLINTLDSSTQYFTKYSDTNVGNGAGTFDSGLNSPYIFIPVQCYDDNDTDYVIYYGANTSQSIASIGKHSGKTSVNSGVSLRGVRVVGKGSSSGYVTFKKYLAK
jgi:hypothetical protein